MTRILSLAAALVVATLPSARAQSSGSGEPGLSLRLLAFSPDLQQREAYAHDAAADDAAVAVPAPIKTYLNHEFVKVPSTARKLIFTTRPERESMKRDGELIGEVTLPQGTRSAILLFLPAAAGDKAKCRVSVVKDSGREFPAGSFHVTNMSPMQVRLMLERKNFDFKPGQVIVIEDPPARETRQIGMRTFVVRDKRLDPVSTGLWSHPGSSRRLMLFFLDPRTGKVQLRAFDDVPPRDERTAAG